MPVILLLPFLPVFSLAKHPGNSLTIFNHVGEQLQLAVKIQSRSRVNILKQVHGSHFVACDEANFIQPSGCFYGIEERIMECQNILSFRVHFSLPDRFGTQIIHNFRKIYILGAAGETSFACQAQPYSIRGKDFFVKAWNFKLEHS